MITLPVHRYSLKSDLLFTAGSYLVLMAISSLSRLLLLMWNNSLADGIPASTILMSFAVGMRFDLIICSLFTAPLALGLLLPCGLRHRSLWVVWMAVVSANLVLVALTEPVFYYEFHSRLNSIALEYINEDPATVLSMVINGTPFFTLIAVWLFSCAIVLKAYLWLDKKYRVVDLRGFKAWALRIPMTLVVICLLIVGGRGGTVRSGAPFRWGDAVHSQYTFANHLALNGMYTFTKAIKRQNEKKDANTVWLTAMDNNQALEITRSKILQPEDKLLNPDALALYRKTVPGKRLLPDNVKNVVIVLMESFSSRYLGIHGDTGNITPYFDKLRDEGVLFDRAFSNGTHTHQGMFATFACFPNTPGNEYLMQKAEGNTLFSGFPAIMHNFGYTNNAYIYNGAFNWDNQKGFFGNQGITHFVGRDVMKNPVFVDPTWGVSDQDMFNRALEELDKLNSKDEPFFAMLQTLSNHMPYALPDPLPVEPVTGYGPRDEHLTAMRYADWAIGKFFEEVKQKPWYNDTLFVLVADHGFSVPEILTPVDMLRFRIPVLVMAPGLRESVGSTVSKVMSQTDVVPIAVSLLGRPFAQHCWGRNILELDETDPGFAIVKPSGNDPIVAMIEGDKVVVKQPDIDPELYSYTLGRKPSARKLDDQTTLNRMYQQMSAFLQTALRSLNNKAVGEKPGIRNIIE